MEQNNFEKDVRKKMDELRIPPSDFVWTNVEKRISKKKRDRRVIFMLLFLLLFITLGGYWLLSSGKNDWQQNQQISKVVKKDADSPVMQKRDSSSFSSTSNPGTIAVKHDSVYVTVKSVKGDSTNFKNDTVQKKIIATKKGESSSVNNETFSSAQKKKIDVEIVTDVRKKNNGDEQRNESGHQPNIREIQSGVANVKIKEGNIDSNEIARRKIGADTLLKKEEREKAVAQMDSAIKEMSKIRQKHKWILGFTFSAGASMLGENPFGIDKSAPSFSDYNNAVSSDPNSGSSIPSNSGSGISLPSAIRNSAAFMGGVYVEKNISSRNKISIGISYQYFSLLSKVGNTIDSIISSSSMSLSQSERFYESVNTVNTYRSHFHYLSIPVSIKFQLNKSETLPLYWQAGITISQLIGSNALQFKYSPGLYYSDNSLFHKTQVGLQTGVSFTLFAKGENPFSIGPYFSYNTSKLAGNGLYNHKHFSFIGIHSEILFRKK
ncbi:MAG: hypothetical protein ABI237_07860 [Ginsengibacter sp.]